jgi:hypothetical protein
LSSSPLIKKEPLLHVSLVSRAGTETCSVLFCSVRCCTAGCCETSLNRCDTKNCAEVQWDCSPSHMTSGTGEWQDMLQALPSQYMVNMLVSRSLTAPACPPRTPFVAACPSHMPQELLAVHYRIETQLSPSSVVSRRHGSMLQTPANWCYHCTMYG